MRAINHALAGAVIGLVLPAPIALPLALVSHYVVDAIPHYGDDRLEIGGKLFKWTLLADAAACGILVLVLGLVAPSGWFIAAVCAFLATSPDLMWAATYVKMQAGKARPTYNNPLVRLHKWIQWYERPAGAYVEIVWFVGMIVLINRII